MGTKKPRNTTAVSAAPQPAAVSVRAERIDYARDAGLGMEGADRESFAIPFLTLLQGLSPQLEHIAGARPGMFINTVTNELFSEAAVIPCAFQRRYLRWAPRAAGGGFRGEYNPVDVETGKVLAVQRDLATGRLTVEGDDLRDTRIHFVLVRPVGAAAVAWQRAILSLTSTQIKKSRRWMSRIQGIELRTDAGAIVHPASFSHMYRLRSVKEENPKGSWWGTEIDLLGPVTDSDAYAQARHFNRQVAAGEAHMTEPTTLATEEFSEEPAF